ncbi:MAG: glycosyltransferase [Deltaproteobacteria bacterium]|nr:glycosyltransferase [Deltaproteobacteria bacterium]
MKILWVSPFLPHPEAPHAGGQTIYRWLSQLARHHEITLLCRLEEKEVEMLKANQIGLIGHIRLISSVFNRPSAGPLQSIKIAASYIRLGRMANRLLRKEDFDLLHVEYIETGLGINAHTSIPRILVAHDELSKPFQRKFALTTGILKRFTTYLYWRAIGSVEHHICRKFDRILVASEQDRKTLLGLNPMLPVTVLPHPIGIDISTIGDTAREENSLLFVGAMHRDVNRDAMRYFCREILPLIRKEIPNVRLTIVGNGPPEDIIRLADSSGIMVTGFVPAIEPYYERAAVFVSPLRIGGGIIIKNLDAMAAGCPVVTTSIGNEGIGAAPCRDLLTADEPAAFAEAVVKLLMNKDERERLARNGQAFVLAHFSLESTVNLLEEAYQEMRSTRYRGSVGVYSRRTRCP